MSLEIVPELPSFDENRIEQLLHLGVACLGLAEYFTDEVNQSLHLVDMTRLVSLDDQDGAHHVGGGGDVHEKDFPVIWCN